jgi:hypothetical protein
VSCRLDWSIYPVVVRINPGLTSAASSPVHRTVDNIRGSDSFLSAMVIRSPGDDCACEVKVRAPSAYLRNDNSRDQSNVTQRHLYIAFDLREPINNPFHSCGPYAFTAD